MGLPQGSNLRWYQGVTHGQWMALLAALLGWMFDGFEMGIFPSVARPALRDLITATEGKDQLVGYWYGVITAAFLVGAALGGWVFGWIGDRVGRVRAMIFSVLTYAIFTGLCGLAQAPWHLVALRFLAALGMGGEWALGVALVMECWAPHARPVLAGLIGAAANVGFVLAATLAWGFEAGGLPMADGGWRWVLGICAFPALLTFFIRMFVPESEKWVHASRTGAKPRFIDIFSPELRRRTILGAVLGGIALIGTWASVQWIPTWVNKVSHGSQGYTSLSVILSGLGAIPGAFLGAVLGSRVSRRWGYFGLSLASLILCAILFRAFSDITEIDWVFLAMVFLVGGVTAAFYGWLPLYLPELFPTRVRATGQGFCFNFGRIIAAAGALSTGLLTRAFDGHIPRAAAVLSLVYIFGLLVVWIVPETHEQALPE
jgi:MFS family permease